MSKQISANFTDEFCDKIDEVAKKLKVTRSAVVRLGLGFFFNHAEINEALVIRSFELQPFKVMARIKLKGRNKRTGYVGALASVESLLQCTSATIHEATLAYDGEGLPFDFEFDYTKERRLRNCGWDFEVYYVEVDDNE